MIGAIELSVVGGPASISLDVGLGAQGKRGTMFYALAGNPITETTAVSQLVPAVQDMDIILNISPSSPTYGTIYQLVPGSSGSTWTPLIDINGGS